MNTTTGVYDTPFRGYDPALGRFMQIDPLAHTSSDNTPYHYANNNPIKFNDPSGAVVPYYANPEDDPRNYRMTIHNDNAYVDFGYGGPIGGGSWSDDHSGAPDYYGDAAAVQSGQMSLEAYAAKYGESDSWLVYNEYENAQGERQGSWSIYFDRSFWGDEGSSFSSKGEALAFGVYKNGWGSEYWAGASADGSFGSGSGSSGDINTNAIGMVGYILETSVHNGADEAIQLGTYTRGATNIAKGVGFSLTAVNVGLTAYTLRQEYNQRKIDTHSFVNAGVALVGAGAAVATAIIGVATAPVWLTAVGIGTAVYGIVYGIDQLSGGAIGIDKGIDDLTNHWGQQFNK